MTAVLTAQNTTWADVAVVTLICAGIIASVWHGRRWRP